MNQVITCYATMARARVVRGGFLLEAGRLDEALEDGEEAVRLDARQPAAHLLLGAIHEARRDPAAAAAAYSEVLRLNPRASVAQLRLARVEMARQALPAATRLAQQVAFSEPATWRYDWCWVGRSWRRVIWTGRRRCRANCWRSRPGSPAVQHQVGTLALARGDRAAARAAFERALTLDPAVMEPIVALVGMDLREANPAAARVCVEQRLQQSPGSSPVLALAGRTWAAIGDLPRGEVLLRRAIEVDSTNLEANGELARVYLAQRRTDAAVAEFDKLAARQSSAVGAQTMAAVILQVGGSGGGGAGAVSADRRIGPTGSGGVEQPGVDPREPW